MPVNLEGGCRVSEMREGTPIENGTVRIWNQVGRAHGAQAISLRTLEFAPGLSPGIRNDDCDEILYVLGDRWERGRLVRTEREARTISRVFIDGNAYEIGPDTGAYLRPGQTLTINNPGPGSLLLISSRCPEPAELADFVAPLTSSAQAESGQSPIVALADKAAMPTGDRWYRVLVDDEVGSTNATQFVGSIPPGRAPDHFHEYEEVLVILRGEGCMWANETNTPIGPGSCIYLPKRQVHCVENTGREELRLLGVFYPAGSPSVRYEA